MVTRVGDIQSHVGEAAATDEILLMDGTTFALTRIPADRFRGAGIFTGTGATPSTTWLGATGGAYRNGDMYTLVNGQDVTMWRWVDTAWVEFADFTPPVFHSETTLGTDAYEVMTGLTGDTADAVFAVGDFYRHSTLRRIYGP